MTAYKKKMLLFTAAFIVCMLSILPWSKVAYASPEAEPTKSTIADKLIIQLGPNWAGVEFELSTDMGKYSETIVVGDNGVLSLELADSSIYTLSCLNSKVPIPAAPDSTQMPATTTAPPEKGESPENQPAVQPSEAQQSEDAEQPQTSQTIPTDLPEDTSSAGDVIPPSDKQGIPTLQLVLFIGGAMLCVGGLIIMQIVKKRREYDDEDDE